MGDQVFRVRMSEGNRLLGAVLVNALAWAGLLMVGIELTIGKDRALGNAVLGGFFVAIVGTTVLIFRRCSPATEVVLDDAALRRRVAGRAEVVIPWSTIARCALSQWTAGDVLELELTDGTALKWTQSSWMSGYAEFTALGKEVARRVEAREKAGPDA